MSRVATASSPREPTASDLVAQIVGEAMSPGRVSAIGRFVVFTNVNGDITAIEGQAIREVVTAGTVTVVHHIHDGAWSTLVTDIDLRAVLEAIRDADQRGSS